MAMRIIEEYPFTGKIYRPYIDESLPLEERVETLELVLSTKCDIQQTSSNDGGNLIDASFKIFFPIDTSKKINIKRGYLFEGEMYGIEVNGEIIGIYPSQLGGCTIFIKDRDV